MNDTEIIKGIGISNRKLTAKDIFDMIKEDGIDELVEELNSLHDEVVARIRPALREAREDEREKIRKILNDGILHSNEEAINRIIDYLNRK